MKKLKSYIKRIIKLLNREELHVLPGHLAFNIVLMIVPVFSLIGVLGSNLDLTRALNYLNSSVPEALMNIINSAISIKTNNFNLLLFIIFSFWIVSTGCRAIINASDVLFKIKEKSIIKKYLKSFLMVIVLFLLIGFIIVVPILGDFIMKFLGNILKDNALDVVINVYNILKYPITLILMFILIKGLYFVSLSIKISPKYMNNGALFTTIAWFILTRIYSFHLNNYSNYNLYYGSLSNILIILVWVYLLAFIFTIGLALNADNYLFSLNKNSIEKNDGN